MFNKRSLIQTKVSFLILQGKYLKWQIFEWCLACRQRNLPFAESHINPCWGITRYQNDRGAHCSMEPLCDASSQCEQDSQLRLLLTRCSVETSTGNLRWICAHWLPSRVCCCFAQGSCVGFGKSCCRQGWLMIKAGECWHHSTSLSFLFVEFFSWNHSDFWEKRLYFGNASDYFWLSAVMFYPWLHRVAEKESLFSLSAQAEFINLSDRH